MKDRPTQIERGSMEIIEAELAAQGITLQPEEAPVVLRCIHASADFDYAKNLRFSPDAVEKALEALKDGAHIVTDTNMALAGVSKPGLKILGALFALAEHLERGMRPALIVAVPVGFVNVVESKEKIFKLCTRLGVPCIAAMGRKGGSSIAAAVCNALIYTAADLLDPAARGWN